MIFVTYKITKFAPDNSLTPQSIIAFVELDITLNQFRADLLNYGGFVISAEHERKRLVLTHQITDVVEYE
jgi:hypothetical protein